jgi:hypothetical protein
MLKQCDAINAEILTIRSLIHVKPRMVCLSDGDGNAWIADTGSLLMSSWSTVICAWLKGTVLGSLLAVINC